MTNRTKDDTNYSESIHTETNQTPHLPCGHPLPQGARKTTQKPSARTSQGARKTTQQPHHQNRTQRMKQLSRSLRHNQTPYEAKLWSRLRNKRLGVKFYRQYLVANEYIADFVCLEKNLIIELDGSQHAENNADPIRTHQLAKRGFTVLRFWNNQIDQNLDACLEEIFQYIYGKIV